MLEWVSLTWLQAVVLAVVQGLTEFLPVSSSGHLRIVSQLFFSADAGASFTAVTQIGTELAVVIYFFGDIARLVTTWFRGMVNAEVRRTRDYRLAWYVIVGSIPIGILGFFFQDLIRGALRSLWITATTLIVFGLLLGLAERYGPQLRRQAELRLSDGVLMGLAQSLALVPGVSRSGGTITAGLSLGLDRPTAVRFSFLLAIPAVFAAGLLELGHVFDPGGPGLQPSGPQMLVATILAGAVGYICIAWLLRYVEKHSVYLFVWWRVIVGLAVYVLLTFGVLQA
ncbi:UDP pyrophosphate phosphatase [Actinopolyspora erythraea]|uniref:Undecaprenyl-diphosphatase n=1 Tax=Actinopolyspora erythraea TaxID=414996 RepID=A0ABR4X4R9_9ACTN|nr:undecaprenyl-diphosphate phosphatase [Actinopolyspora erythraea]KGI81435.1 UDP pyrophosphate phosphatase [Actinopolyspora erythraea]